MSELISKAIDTAQIIEGSGINYFSGLARMFSRTPELKSGFEQHAKSKINTKKFFADLAKGVSSHSVSVKNPLVSICNLDQFEELIDETDVVGEHSLPEDLLKTAFKYLRESNRLLVFLKDNLSTTNELGQIINSNKQIIELIKKHIHNYSEEIKFYGYE